MSSTMVGCANLNSIYRNKELGENKIISVDAKQRMVFATKKKLDDDSEILHVCSEPSPDVFTVAATAFGASASAAEKFAGALSFSSAESGGTIGLRTETIQLLRDVMYRLCEGARNGDLNPGEFEKLHRRYQKGMVALIAINQLAQAAAPPATILTSQSNSSASVFQQLNKEKEQFEKQLIEEEKKMGEHEKCNDTTKLEECKKCTKPEEHNKTYCEIKDKLNEVKDAKNGLKIVSAAQAGGQAIFVANTQRPPLPDHVSKAITEIVGHAFDVDRTEACSSYFIELSLERNALAKNVGATIKSVDGDDTGLRTDLLSSYQLLSIVDASEPIQKLKELAPNDPVIKSLDENSVDLFTELEVYKPDNERIKAKEKFMLEYCGIEIESKTKG